MLWFCDEFRSFADPPDGFLTTFFTFRLLFDDESSLLSLSELLLEPLEEDAELAELMIALDFGGGFSTFFSTFGFSTTLAAGLGRASSFGLGAFPLLMILFVPFVGVSDSELFSGEKMLFFLFGSVLEEDFVAFCPGFDLLDTSLTFDPVLTPTFEDFAAASLEIVCFVGASRGVIVALLFGLTGGFLLTACLFWGVFTLSSSSVE